MTAATTTLGEQVAEVLRGYRFRMVDEYDLQDEIETVLLSTPFAAALHREHRLSSRDRIDFLCDAVGIEVKVDGPTSAVHRQLRRYASHPDVDELVLVTTRARHTQLTYVGCPLHIVTLLGVT